MPASISLDRAILRPIACSDLVRVGSEHGDGGYVVPLRAVSSTQVLLSLGLSDDWSFDQHFQKLNPTATIVGVDHSISPVMFAKRTLKHAVKSIAYRSVGSHSKAQKHSEKAARSSSYFTTFRSPNKHIRKKVGRREGRTECTLDSLLCSVRAQGNDSVFLKVDIESSEYDVLADVMRHADIVHCVVVEFHELDARTVSFNDTIRQLQEQYSIVHVHGNNYAPYDMVMDFPVSVEITFLRHDLIDDERAESRRTLPCASLDRPNDAGRPDHPIRFST